MAPSAGKICSIDGCSKPVYGHNWCSPHYQRWRRNGDPLAGRNRPNGGEPLLQYLKDHMWDDCPKWPFGRTARGYGRLTVDGKNDQYAHRYVCETVHGPAPSPSHQAAHSCRKGHEGCFGANCLSWKTPKENSEDAFAHGTAAIGEKHPAAKLTAAQAKQIFASSADAVDLALLYGVSPRTVKDIQTGRSWRSVNQTPVVRRDMKAAGRGHLLGG